MPFDDWDEGPEPDAPHWRKPADDDDDTRDDDGRECLTPAERNPSLLRR